jgi:hypothetical protein
MRHAQPRSTSDTQDCGSLPQKKTAETPEGAPAAWGLAALRLQRNVMPPSRNPTIPGPGTS